jgi:hypothetical protein
VLSAIAEIVDNLALARREELKNSIEMRLRKLIKKQTDE